MSDIKQMFEGWYSQSEGPSGAVHNAMPKIREGVDLIKAAIEDELDSIIEEYEFDPPPHPRDYQEMERLITKYIQHNFGVTPALARGIAAEVVWGED